MPKKTIKTISEDNIDTTKKPKTVNKTAEAKKTVKVVKTDKTVKAEKATKENKVDKKKTVKNSTVADVKNAKNIKEDMKSDAKTIKPKTHDNAHEHDSIIFTNHELTPSEIVAELDKHIISQNEAKKAVAIALRNRWRRSQLDENLRKEIKPKNILMIGPTGVGKTEIARRLADLVQAPFIKVEATKFTEVGYVGRDVESIIRDLMEVAFKKTKEMAMNKVRDKAYEHAIKKVLEYIVPSTKVDKNAFKVADQEETPGQKLFRQKLLAGELDDMEIEIETSDSGMGVEILGPPGVEEISSQITSMISSLGGLRKKKRKMKVKNAIKKLCDDEASTMINEEEIRSLALKRVEQQGIVFIDEIDKITQPGGMRSGAYVSRDGVQRDLLPLVEGCSVSTKYGIVKTDHILFIASGAFHLSKPSDLVPELQGRFPIRVELNPLSVEDFLRILTEPQASLIEQYEALLGTENVTLDFTEDCLLELAKVAFQVNEKTENIGARRLYTIMEKLLEDVSFLASEKTGEKIKIDAKYVTKRLSELVKNEDLSRYVL